MNIFKPIQPWKWQMFNKPKQNKPWFIRMWKWPIRLACTGAVIALLLAVVPGALQTTKNVVTATTGFVEVVRFAGVVIWNGEGNLKIASNIADGRKISLCKLILSDGSTVVHSSIVNGKLKPADGEMDCDLIQGQEESIAQAAIQSQYGHALPMIEDVVMSSSDFAFDDDMALQEYVKVNDDALPVVPTKKPRP